MAFKLKSGNTTNFKGMGSSPAKQWTPEKQREAENKTAKEFREREELERRERIERNEIKEDNTYKPKRGNEIKVKPDRKQPTYEGTDEFRPVKDIPKKEFKEKGVKKSPAKQKKKDKKLPKKVTAKDYIIQDVSEIQKDDKGLYVTGLDDGSFENNSVQDTSYLPPNATLYNEEGGKKYKEGDYLDETDFEENYFGYDHSKKKAKNPTPKKKSPAKQRVSDLPKNFNTKGSSNTGPKIKSKVDANRASKVKTQNFRNEANKIKTVSSTTNKGSKVIQQVAKKQGKKQLIKKAIGKAATRLIPGAGWALAAYDVGSWAYENRKDLKKHAKIVKEKRMKNPSDHGRPKY